MIIFSVSDSTRGDLSDSLVATSATQARSEKQIPSSPNKSRNYMSSRLLVRVFAFNFENANFHR